MEKVYVTKFDTRSKTFDIDVADCLDSIEKFRIDRAIPVPHYWHEIKEIAPYLIIIIHDARARYKTIPA